MVISSTSAHSRHSRARVRNNTRYVARADAGTAANESAHHGSRWWQRRGGPPAHSPATSSTHSYLAPASVMEKVAVALLVSGTGTCRVHTPQGRKRGQRGRHAARAHGCARDPLQSNLPRVPGWRHRGRPPRSRLQRGSGWGAGEQHGGAAMQLDMVRRDLNEEIKTRRAAGGGSGGRGGGRRIRGGSVPPIALWRDVVRAMPQRSRTGKGGSVTQVMFQKLAPPLTPLTPSCPPQPPHLEQMR